MMKIIETGMKQSIAMLAMIASVMMFTGSAQTANAFNAAQIQQPNIRHVSNVNTAKIPIYHYVANTSSRARRQGRVNASGLVWNCKDNRCTISGPWPKPSVTACQKLASLVGPIRSYGRSGHYLSANYMRQCNRRLVRHNQKQKRVVRAASHAKVNLAKRNIVPELSNREKQRARMFFARLPVDSVIKTKLSRGRDVRYLVVTNALSGRSHRIERRTWTGKILLPDLRRRGKVKPIHFTGKMRNGVQSRKGTVWLIENPDGSLSKQILNSSGRLAGNITVTRDGSVRIGIDLNGDQVADLYETTISSGEHTILASPAGQAAWDHFRNGGKNPLCNTGAASAGDGRLPGAAGARGVRSASGGFAGGMISGGDKTAMQVVCGQRDHKPANGGSAAGGGRGISGDPAGRATNAMCKKVLGQHRGRPGNPGMVQSNPAGVTDPLHHETFHTNPRAQAIGSFLLRFVKRAGAIIRLISGNALMLDASPDALFPNSPSSADPIAGQQTDPDAAMLSYCQRKSRDQAFEDAITKDTRYIHQLCENPQSQPNPAGLAGSVGRASSTTLGGSYDSSVTLTTYCGQHGGNRSVPSPSDRLSGQTGSGSNCGQTESPGADGRCHVGTQFNGGSAGSVNVSYGAVIGIPLFDPRVYRPDPRL